MGGEGSIQSLLNNNQNLLRKKRLFDRTKSISERKKELLNLNNGKLQFKKISDKELNVIKVTIQNRAKKRDLRNTVYFLIILIFIGSLITVNLNKRLTLEKELKSKAENYFLQKELQENLKKHNIYLEDAEDQFNKEHWKNAIYFYKKALTLNPNDSLSVKKLKISEANLIALNSQ